VLVVRLNARADNESFPDTKPLPALNQARLPMRS
jgi:hypothetical protein